MSNINRRGGYQTNNNRNLGSNASLPALNSKRSGYGRKASEEQYANRYGNQNNHLKAPAKA